MRNILFILLGILLFSNTVNAQIYTITGGQNYCEGAPRDPIVITFTGTAPFNFQYTRDGIPSVIENYNSTIYSILNPEAGIYQLTGTVTDGEGTITPTDNRSTTVVINPISSAGCACSPPTNLQVSETNVVACVGTNVTVVLTGVLGTSVNGYLLKISTPSSPGTYALLPALPYTYTLTNVTKANEGVYTFTVEDGNVGNSSCLATASFTLTVPVPPTPAPTIPSVCEWSTLTLQSGITNPPSGTIFTWSGPGNPVYSSSTQNPTRANATFSMIGTYSLYTTLNGCKSKTVTVNGTINPIPVSSWETTDFDYCGTSGITLTSTQVAGATYSWKKNSTPFPALVTNSGVVTAGVYDLRLTKDGCTYDLPQVTVTQHDNPTYTISGGANYCAGDTRNPLVIKFLTGSPSFIFSYAIDGVTNTPVISSTNTYYISNPQIGIYNLSGTITDGNGCTASATTASTSVIINLLPTVILQDVSVCASTDNINLADIMIVARPSTGTGIFSTTGTGISINPTTGVFTHNGKAGVYTITYSHTDNGCTTSKTALFTVNANPVPTILGSPRFSICQNQQILLSVGGGTFSSQVWGGVGAAYLGGANSIATPTFTGYDEGDFDITLTVTDEKGCIGATTESIYVYPKPTVTLSQISPLCIGAPAATITATVNPIGGTGVWTGVTVISVTTASFNPTIAGANTVSYRYTSVQGCVSDPVSTIITVNPLPDFTLGFPTICSVVNNIDLNDWVLSKPLTGSGIFSSTDNRISVTSDGMFTSYGMPGEFLISYSHTINGCTATKSQTLTMAEPPAPIIICPNSICQNVNQPLSVSGSYKTFEWTGSGAAYLNGANTSATPTFSGSVSGVFEISVKVLDEYSCVGSTSKTIFVNPTPTTTLSAMAPLCVGSPAATVTATVSPTGGTGVWTGAIKSSETTASFYPSIAGANQTVGYTYTSAAGCVGNPVLTQITVNPLPVLSISYSGYNSVPGICSYAAALPATLSYGMGTVSISPASSALNTSNGTFDPSLASSGTYTITYNYTDPTTGCVGIPVTTQIKVNPRPVTDISANPTQICDNDAPITLQTTLAGGTFAGHGVSGTQFNPSVVFAGDSYIITYYYTDPATGCDALETTHQITVNHANPPLAVNASALNTTVNNQSQVPNVSAVGTAIQWYALNDNSSALIASGANYQNTFVDADVDGSMDAGIYYMYATQTINGCQSEPTEVRLTISSCNVAPPNANNNNICENEGTSTISATAVGSGNLAWWADQASVPANPTPYVGDQTGDSWTINSGISTPGAYTYYVAEYDLANSCFGPLTPVTIIVHPNPVPSITDPGMICSTTPSVAITFAPGSGVLSGTGVSGTNTWTPQFDNSKTGVTNTTLTLDVSVSHGTAPDGIATCSAQATRSVSVTHVLAPTGTGIDSDVLLVLPAILSLPLMEINYISGANVIIKDKNGNIVGTEADLPLNVLPFLDNTVGKTEFYVQQIYNGCESPVAVSVWNIISCPTPAPNPIDVSICEGDILPVINANGSPDGLNFVWKEETGMVISTTQYLDISTLGTSYSAPGSYRFTVSQEAIDPSGQLCRGLEGDVVFTVNPEPKFTLELSESPVACFNSDNVIITPAPANSGYTFSSVAYNIFGGSANSSAIQKNGLIGTIDPKSEEIGIMSYGTFEYTIEAVITDTKSCTSSASANITIQNTPKPVCASIVSMENSSITSFAAQGINVKWYDSNLNFISSGLTYTPSITGVGIYEFYVTQTINNCESDYELVTYTVNGNDTLIDPISVSLPATLSIFIMDQPMYVAPVITPENATFYSFTWESHDDNIATVNNGLITPVGVGTTQITVTTNKGLSAVMNVIVWDEQVYVTEITIPEQIKLYAGETAQVEHTIIPFNVTTKELTWIVDNPSIAHISANAQISAIAAGTTTIKAMSNNGVYSNTCIIIVEANPAPEISDIPQIDVNQGLSSTEINILQYISDLNNPDETLVVEVQNTDSVLVSYDENTGTITFTSLFPEVNITDTVLVSVVDPFGVSSESEIVVSFKALQNLAPNVNIPDIRVEQGDNTVVLNLQSIVADDYTSPEEIVWIVDAGENIMVTQNADGSVIIEPKIDTWTGTDTIRFIAKDALGKETIITIDYTVEETILNNSEPVISSIPELVNSGTNSFNPINLNLYIQDDYTLPQNIVWEAESTSEISVIIENNIAYTKVVDSTWYGKIDVWFYAQDNKGLRDSIQITFNQTSPINTVVPVITYSADKYIIFAGQSVNFSSEITGADSWKWIFTGGDIEESVLSNPTVVYNTPGTYKTYMTAKNEFITDTISNDLDIIVIGIIQDDFMLCAGSDTSLSVFGPNCSYLWSTGESTANISISPEITTTYVVSISDGLSENIQSITITVSEKVSLPSDTAFCENESIVVDAGEFSEYLWSDVTSEIGSSRSIELSEVGKYFVQVTDYKNCISKDSIIVTDIYSVPEVDLGNDIELNSGSSILLDANSDGTYLWNTNETSKTISVSVGGEYSVIITNSDNCSGTDTVRVLVKDPTVFKELSDEIIIDIYPVPANKIVNIRILSTKSEFFELKIRNIAGINVLSKIIGANTAIDISDLTSGSYIISVSSEEYIVEKLFIKE